MSRPDFLLPFVGIIVGLGVADLLLSVHRSIRRGRRWHWLPASWAALTFVCVLMYWWVLAEVIVDEEIGTFFGFAFHLGSPILLFLACAAVLPDDPTDDRPLLDYYFDNRRYFFGLLAAYFVHIALDYGFNYATWSQPPPWFCLGLAALVLPLAFSDKRGVHVALTGLFGAYIGVLLLMYTVVL